MEAVAQLLQNDLQKEHEHCVELTQMLFQARSLTSQLQKDVRLLSQQVQATTFELREIVSSLEDRNPRKEKMMACVTKYFELRSKLDVVVKAQEDPSPNIGFKSDPLELAKLEPCQGKLEKISEDQEWNKVSTEQEVSGEQHEDSKKATEENVTDELYEGKKKEEIVIGGECELKKTLNEEIAGGTTQGPVVKRKREESKDESELKKALRISGNSALMLQEASVKINEGAYSFALRTCLEVIKDILIKMKASGLDSDKAKELLKKYAEDYVKYASELDIVPEKKIHTTYHEHFQIKFGSCGYDYLSLFGHYLNDEVHTVVIEETYLFNSLQLSLFIHLVEVLVRYCRNLRRIHLTTVKNFQSTEQNGCFTSLGHSLELLGVTFNFEYSDILHDRHIRLNNGWAFTLGKGLDIYQPVDSYHILGVYDLFFRRCIETSVDVYFEQSGKAVQKFVKTVPTV